MADTPENNETEAQDQQTPEGQADAQQGAAKDAQQETPENTGGAEAGGSKNVELDEFETPEDSSKKAPSGDQSGDAGLEAVYDIPVRVSAVLGETQMEINKLLKLGRGAVVVLDRKIGEAIDIYVNERLVARGEVVIADEDKLGVTMTEIVKLPK